MFRGERKMCELLGMSFNKPVRPKISFKGFKKRGDRNPHGWGLAYYPDRSVQVFKEPIKAATSHLAEFIIEYPTLKSNIFIGHVRLSSVGSISHKNTHPFQRELDGKEYVFAHNGTLRFLGDEVRSLSQSEILSRTLPSLGRLKPIGETDSEYAFCHILHEIVRRKIQTWNSENFSILKWILQDVNKLGRFNCIFSDGEYLFCYHSRIDNPTGRELHLLQRKSPFGSIKLLDDDWEVDLQEEKDPNQTGYIIATEPLTNEHWIPFKTGELKVFKNGEMIYSEID